MQNCRIWTGQCHYCSAETWNSAHLYMHCPILHILQSVPLLFSKLLSSGSQINTRILYIIWSYRTRVEIMLRIWTTGNTAVNSVCSDWQSIHSRSVALSGLWVNLRCYFTQHLISFSAQIPHLSEKNITWIEWLFVDCSLIFGFSSCLWHRHWIMNIKLSRRWFIKLFISLSSFFETRKLKDTGDGCSFENWNDISEDQVES